MKAKQQRPKGTGSLFKRVERGVWIALYFNHAGKRCTHSTRTTDKGAAQRILTHLVTESALRRDGVINPRDDRYAIESRKPLAEQITAYIAHCTLEGQAPQSLFEKGAQLRAMIVGSKATRLGELTADALELHLTSRKHQRLSPRTVNRTREIAVAFMNWCVKTGRAETNALLVVPKQDQARDRRRVRRALTDSELSRLIEVARERGREAWYLAAAFAGLRRGDMVRLTWSAINFQDSTITIRDGKAKRCDVIPMHPQLAESLMRHQQAHPSVPLARVWSGAVGNLTRVNDFKRAGIDLVDAEGRVADLHALRSTLATNLARTGVTPQVAQRIMRHSNYETTLKHYTVLGLTDTTAAIERLSSILPPSAEPLRATGTSDTRTADLVSAVTTAVGVRNGAKWRETVRRIEGAQREMQNEKTPLSQGFSHDLRDFSQRARRGSNLQPSVSKTDALSN